MKTEIPTASFKRVLLEQQTFKILSTKFL